MSTHDMRNRKLVLVVDDDTAILRGVARLLRRMATPACCFPRRKPSQITEISTAPFASFSTST